ncbi:MAG: N-acetylmuramoyl-L-alanine amidase [Ginsengibacter sp.]
MHNKKLLNALLLAILITVISCSGGKYAATNKEYKQQVKSFSRVIRQYPLKDSLGQINPFVGTINFGMRKPNFVIIHHTAQNSCDQTLNTFTLKRTQVSAHYVICREGKIYHMLSDYLRAWHAGSGTWGNDSDVNSSSIGIELDNNGFEVFSEAQITSLLQLLQNLKKAYNIPQANFIGHADIAPTRKNDPNVYFPWKKLSENGFGLWYNDTTRINLPQNFNDLSALRIVGYNIKDTTAAIRAFKRHFEQQDSSGVLNDNDRKILYEIARKNQ